MTKWKGDPLNPTPLCDALEKTRKISADGKVTFRGAGWDELTHTLSGMADLPKFVPPFEHHGMMVKSLFAAGRLGAITPEAVIAQLSSVASDYAKRPKEQYSLLSQIALPTTFLPRPIRVGGERLTFSARVSNANHSLFEARLKETSSLLGRTLPTNFLWVRVTTSGRSPLEAGDLALETLDKVRAVWNLFFNRRLLTRFSSTNQPINQITLGPIQLLFNLKASPAASDLWWYEPSY